MELKSPRPTLGVKDDAEGAEYDDLEEANIGKMDDLFETESETSDKEAKNYKCAICQKMYIDNTELIEHVECAMLRKTRSLRRMGKTSLVPTARNSLATAKKY